MLYYIPATRSLHKSTREKPAPEIKVNLTSIWEAVVQTTTPNNRSLLQQATLVKFETGCAVLAVPSQHFRKFNTNAEKVAKIIQKATSTQVTVSIQEAR